MTASSPIPDADAVREVLRRVIDPEVGVNIVDLGLIYGIDVSAEEVRITMTMTSPACPMADILMDDIDAAINDALPQDLRVFVDLVWEPPWSREMMSDEARKHFGG